MNAPADNVVALIPAYNEAGRVGDVVRRTRAQVARVVVVDDASADGTGDEAGAAGAEVLRHPANRGKGAALTTGFARCREMDCEWIVLLDADGQHDPADIPKLLAMRGDGSTLVVGNRMAATRAMPWPRCIANRVSSRILSRLCGQPVPDSQCGFRLLHRSVLDAIKFTTQHYECESEMLILAARAGYRIASAPVRTIYGGENSHIRPWQDVCRFFRLVLRYRRQRR
jgi:glycosyltransferase involved in cell wall biosynthesis